MNASILAIDDEPIIRETLAEFLTLEGYTVVTAGSGAEAVRQFRERAFDVVVCDVSMPGMDGLEVLARLREHAPDTSLIFITAYATVESAIEAFRAGAADYLMKPLILDEVSGKIHRLLQLRALQRENRQLRLDLHLQERNESTIVGSSPVMVAVRSMARKLAATRSTVLLQGESGTGKEIVARAIHARSDSEYPGRFLAVNCATLCGQSFESQLFGESRRADGQPAEPGVFVRAGRGTIFFDEIADLPTDTQAQLLRAIDRKEILPVGSSSPVSICARIVAATNRNLLQEVEAGRFREDLYFRLAVVTVRLPPLRERREDIPELVAFLLRRHAEILGRRVPEIAPVALSVLQSANWRGNVRELDNALGRAMILSESPAIAVADLPAELVPSESDPYAVDALEDANARFEKLHIERILRQTADKKEAARRLGIGLSSLYRRLESLRIDL